MNTPTINSTRPRLKISDVDLASLKQRVARQPERYFAILDACDEPRVPMKTKELGRDQAVSLYRGSAEQDFWAIAPYLVRVDPSMLDWIVENLWDAPWGVFIYSVTDLASLRTHLRRFLQVELPNNQKVFFRFYDPRVLRTFLTTMTTQEIQQFFGASASFLCTVSPGKLQEFSHSAEQ